MTTAPTAAYIPPLRVARLVAVVFFLQLLDSTIIATSLPAMAADFGVTPVGMSIGITAYMLAMAVVIPAAGWLGERFGARKVLVWSIGGFILSSLACALATGLDMFVAARIVQGASAALMAPVGRMIVLRNAPKSDLMRAISTITWPALSAPVIGPILGAWITETFGWHWNFLINVPLGLICIALFLALVPDQGRESQQRFDWRGFVLTALALLLLLTGLETFIGDSPVIVAASMAIAGVGFLWLAWRHMRAAVQPLFDLRVLRVTSFRMATMTVGTLGRITINATPFLLPLLFQVGFGLSAIAAGKLVLIYFLGNWAMKSITSPIMTAFGFRRVLTVNGTLAALSIGAFALVPADFGTVAMWALLFVAGATRSMQFTALNTLAFADISATERATSTTFSAMTQQVAMLLGVALPVLAIRASSGLRGDVAGLADFRVALAVMSVFGVLSALSFLRLRPDTGSEVSGHVM